VSNTVAWILQALLAVVFLLHGIMYALSPEPMVRSMRDRGAWPPAIPSWFRVFIGVAELLAAVGLVLPGLLHLLTFLTPLAAAGLVVVMVGAVVYHLRRAELVNLPPVVVLLVLSAVVLFLRWQVAPLS
jgi:uncharacterized membrane protein YphA (DoxX/SURF4 family)